MPPAAPTPPPDPNPNPTPHPPPTHPPPQVGKFNIIAGDSFMHVIEGVLIPAGL